MRQTTATFALVSVLTLSACAPNDSLEPTLPRIVGSAMSTSEAALTRRTVPFRYRGTTLSEAPSSDPRCPESIVRVQARGTATLLGRITGDVSHCITSGSLDFTDGRFVFRGENGTELHGRHFGSFTPTSEPNVFTFDGEITRSLAAPES
jgi:hypothetical protein